MLESYSLHWNYHTKLPIYFTVRMSTRWLGQVPAFVQPKYFPTISNLFEKKTTEKQLIEIITQVTNTQVERYNECLS